MTLHYLSPGQHVRLKAGGVTMFVDTIYQAADRRFHAICLSKGARISRKKWVMHRLDFLVSDLEPAYLAYERVV